MDADEVFTKLQDFLRTKPILLIGTGLSVSMGLPGMRELTECLKNEMPAKCDGSASLLAEWVKCLKSIDAYGLEEGLGKHEVCPELLNLIVETTATCIESKDTMLKKTLISNSTKPFPLAKGLSIILCKHSCFRTPAIEYIPPNDLQNRSKTGPISGPSFESGRSTFS